MANMQKYKASQCGHVLGENLRDDARHRERVDESLTPGNYNLASCRDPRCALADAMAGTESATGRKMRKDANVMFSWVVTLPDDVREGDERRFFEAAHAFMNERYGGEGLCLCSVVHVDEPRSRQHLHECRLPMVSGKLNASKMVGRKDLQTFHSDLSKAVEAALGYRVSVLLSEDEAGRKALSSVPRRKMDAAAKALDSALAERRERVEEAEREREAAASEAESLRDEARDVGERIGAAQRAIRAAVAWVDAHVGLMDAMARFIRETGLSDAFAKWARRNAPGVLRAKPGDAREIRQGLEDAADALEEPRRRARVRR